MTGSNETFQKLAEAVQNYDSEGAVGLTREALRKGVGPFEIVESGLALGLRRVGEQFGRHELFLPDLVMASEAMKAALSVLEPELAKRGGKRTLVGRIVIGTVEGDVHDIGKSIVTAVLAAGGFEVIDLGVDVKATIFVDRVRELRPDILGLSALLSTTVLRQREVAEALTEAGLRKIVRMLVGGAAVTREWAEEMGADGFAKDAFEALEVSKKMMRR